MSEWRELLAEKKWGDLENWWRHCKDAVEVRAFFYALRDAMPKKKLRNGMESSTVPVSTREATAEWKGGAQILELGELESQVMGAIPRPAEQLRLEIVSLTGQLHALLAQPEPTKGDDAFSRAQHVNAVFGQLDELRKITAAASSTKRPQINAWVEDIIAEAFLCGLEAGRHLQAAIGKDIEHLAVKGEGLLLASSKGGEMRKAPYVPRDEAIFAEMQRRMGAGTKKVDAAQHTFLAGLGTSADANLKVYDKLKRQKK